MFYKNTTNENLSPLNIPSCGVKCSVENFRRIYEAVIPTETFEKECQVSLMSMTYDFRGLDGSKNDNSMKYCFNKLNGFDISRLDCTGYSVAAFIVYCSHGVENVLSGTQFAMVPKNLNVFFFNL